MTRFKLLLLAFLAIPVMAQPRITFSGAIVAPGLPATVNLTLVGGGMSPAGLQLSFLVPDGAVIVPGPALANTAKVLYQRINTSSAIIMIIGEASTTPQVIPDGIVASINFPSAPFVFTPTGAMGVSPAGSLVTMLTTNFPYVNQCDLNKDGALDTLDLRNIIDQIDGAVACTNGDLDGDTKCTIVDAQRVAIAMNGGTCKVGK